MIEEFVLKVQRLAREHPEHAFRDQALSLVQATVPFDTGSWGTVRTDRIGMTLCDVHVYGQTEALVQSYLHIRAYDLLGTRTREQLGRPQIFSWGDSDNPGHESFRSHCESFGHYNILSTMACNALGSHHSFITLARTRREARFDDQNRKIMQRLVPHLLDAWLLNCSWHMQGAQDEEDGGVVKAICSASGRLMSAYPDFVALLNLDFPGWASPCLPPALLSGFETRGAWAGSRVEVRHKAIADVLFLTARMRSDISMLTSREMTIARHAADGLSYKEIARVLDLSPATVRTHLHNNYGKLNITNKTALSRAVSAGGRRGPLPTLAAVNG